MHLLTVSGSARTDSSNVLFLKALPNLMPEHQFEYFNQLANLPLFNANHQSSDPTPTVKAWRKAIALADGVIISTPEYLHNLPALLKNAFEWVTDSGEFYEKKVLAITFTPNPPRGEKAMQSMLWSLQALNARVVASLAIYKSDLMLENGLLPKNDYTIMLQEAVQLLI